MVQTEEALFELTLTVGLDDWPLFDVFDRVLVFLAEHDPHLFGPRHHIDEPVDFKQLAQIPVSILSLRRRENSHFRQVEEEFFNHLLKIGLDVGVERAVRVHY